MKIKYLILILALIFLVSCGTEITQITYYCLETNTIVDSGFGTDETKQYLYLDENNETYEFCNSTWINLYEYESIYYGNYSPINERTECTKWVELNNKKDRKCVTSTNIRFKQDINNKWTNAINTLDLKKSGSDILIQYQTNKKNMSLTLEVGFLHTNGNIYSISDVRQTKPYIQISFPKEIKENHIKYAINISNLTQNDMDNFEAVTISYKNHSGFPGSKLKQSNLTMILNDIIGLDFTDIQENNFTINVNLSEKRYYITNLDANFNNGELYLDPSVGFTFPGTGTSDSSAGGSAWTNPGNIINDDGVPALSASLFTPSTTQILRSSNFNFSITDNAIIDGLECKIEARDSRTSPLFRFNNVYIMNTSGIAATKTITEDVAATYTVYTYGNSTDTWGLSLTGEDVNNINFGCGPVFQATSGPPNTMDVDYIQMNIHYSELDFGSLIEFIDPTPADLTETINRSFTVNVSIYDNESTLNTVNYIFNDNTYDYLGEDNFLNMDLDNVSSAGENGTTIIDKSQYENNGYFNGTKLVTDGVWGKAIDFDGSSNYILINDSASLDTTVISMIAWINPDLAHTGNIFSRGNSAYRMRTRSSRKIGITLSTTTISGVESTILYNLNEWNFIAATYNGTHVDFYINNNTELGVAFPNPGAIDNATVDLLIGALSTTSGSERFNGEIDEPRLYNRVLTPDEIYQQYIGDLRQINRTNFLLEINQSKDANNLLDNGTYTYRAEVYDRVDNYNTTEERVLFIPSIPIPEIEFVNPTPANDTVTSNTSIIINTTITDSNIVNITHNWNGTLFNYFDETNLYMYNFDNNSELGDNSTISIDFGARGVESNMQISDVTYVDGKYGKGLFFNETGATPINVLGAATGPWHEGFTERSYSMRLNAINTTRKQVLFDEGGSTNGVGIYIEDNVLYGCFRDATEQDTVSYPFNFENEFKHISLAWNVSGPYLYLDGQLVNHTSSVITDTEISAHSGNPSLGYVIDSDGCGNTAGQTGGSGTTGATFPGTVVTDPTVGTTITWTNPNNIKADDGSTSFSSKPAVAGTYLTANLNATNFGLDIPDGTTITGIEMIYERAYAIFPCTFPKAQLIKNGVPTGDVKTDATAWTAIPAFQKITYGNSTDLWGTTWTESDIESSTFGVKFNATMAGPSTTVCHIDYIQLNVSYTGEINTQNFTGIIDEFRVDNKTFNQEDAYQVSRSYLKKVNNTDWYLQINQSQNATTGLSNGNYTYSTTACNPYACNSTETRTIEIGGEPPIVDDIYPIFYNYGNNSEELIISGIVNLNVSINNSNGTANIVFNGTTYPMSNVSNFYNVSFEFLKGAGTYQYYYESYGNGTDNNYNSSPTFNYIILQDSTSKCDVEFNKTSPLTYPSNFTAYTNCTTAFILNRNGTEISNNSIQVLSAGTYNFTVNRNDTINYTNIYDSELFTINKANPAGSITGTTPILSPDSVNIQGIETNNGDGDLTYNLYRNDVLVSNPDTETLSIGTYVYVYNTTGGQNYTSNSSLDTFTLNVIPRNVSLFHTDGEVETATTSSQIPELIFNQSFNLSIPTPLIVYASGGFEGTTGGTVNPFLIIKIDNTILYNASPNDINGINDRKQFNLPTSKIDLNSGEHIFQVFFYTDVNKGVTLNDLRLFGDVDYTNFQNSIINLKVENISETFSGVGPNNILNISFNKTKLNSSTRLKASLSYTTTGTTIIPECYFVNNQTLEQTSTSKRYLASSSSVGSAGNIYQTEILTKGNETWQLWCGSDDGSQVTINGTVYLQELRDANGNIINGFKIQNTSLQTIGSGTTKILNYTYTPINASAMEMAVNVNFQSTSASQVGINSPIIKFNTSQIPESECSVQYPRSFTLSNQPGVVQMYISCDNITIGTPIDFNIYSILTVGNSIEVLNITMIGSEGAHLDLETGLLPPIVSIITPAFNSTQSGLINITADISDLSEVGWASNISLLNFDMSFNQTIYDDLGIRNNITNTTFDTSTVFDGDYYIRWIVQDGGSPNNDTHLIEIDNTAPIINITYPLPQLYNISVTELNYTINEQNLDSCWYNLGGSNITTNCDGNIDGISSNNGNNTWTVYANDTQGNIGFDSVTFEIIPPDQIYPTFDNFTTNSGQLTGSGNVSINYTISNTNGTFGLNFNGINRTCTNTTGLINNQTDVSCEFEIFSSGTFNYFSFGYGSGQFNNYNQSETFQYTILSGAKQYLHWWDYLEGTNRVTMGGFTTDNDFYLNTTLTVENLSGTGNAYACLDTNGMLFRSNTACV